MKVRKIKKRQYSYLVVFSFAGQKYLGVKSKVRGSITIKRIKTAKSNISHILTERPQ